MAFCNCAFSSSSVQLDLDSRAVRKKSITSCCSVCPSNSWLRFVAAVSYVIERYGGIFLFFLDMTGSS